jgi:hypothetical protein
VTGAQADELSALKAQLEALQSRVNQIETTAPAASSPTMPAGASWITFNRGAGGNSDRLNENLRPQEYIPADTGFTIAITPTADLPAPVHEVTVSGYVKGDIIFDTRNNLGDTFAVSAVRHTGGDSEHVRLHARQSRFRIRSRSDTAVGQVRTLIEGDFFGGGANELVSNSSPFRLRHAWAEWDITPNTTIGIGQTWSNYMNLFALADTVDFFGQQGVAFARQAQLRITYTSGPMLFAVAVENPESDMAHGTLNAGVGTCNETLANACEANDNVPDFTARLQYSAPGGHTFHVSGVLRNLRVDGDSSTAAAVTGSDSEIAWGVIGAASVNLADIATLTGGIQYGEGLGRYISGGAFAGAVLNGTAANPNIRTVEQLGIWGALAFGLTDTTTANLVFGYYDANAGDLLAGGAKNAVLADEQISIHANLIWQPVSRFRMGVEAMWGEQELINNQTEDMLRFQFGAWFFF